jgi:prepilin-type N-terminal cleavage/methylation domain-containing protein
MNRSGFTTIEMAIVVIIVGIIAMFGFPKIRTALDKTNVRSARVSISSFAAEARAAAAQRGCRAVIHFLSGATSRAWVTACPRQQPGAGSTVDTVAMIDDVAARFSVQMTITRDSVQYDPRGLSMDNVNTIVRFTGNAAGNTDSVVINSLGRVVR